MVSTKKKDSRTMPPASRGEQPLAQPTRRRFQSAPRSVTKISVSLPSRPQAGSIESPCRPSLTSPSATRRCTLQVPPSPRIQHGMKRIPLTPTTRRLLMQSRRPHFAHPSTCQKQAPDRVWVAPTIIAPSGVCLPRVRTPSCAVA